MRNIVRHMDTTQRDEAVQLARTGQVLDSRGVVIAIEPRLINTRLAAEIYGGVSQRFIERLIAEEGFPSVRIGRRILVPVAKADRWIEERVA